MSSGEGIRAIGSVAAPRGLMRCPHCEAPAIIRRSEAITQTIKHLGMICTNETCGHTWLAQISPVYTICPSHVPNPEVHIPPAPAELLRWHHRKLPGTGRDDDDPDQMTIFDVGIEDPPPRAADQPTA